MSTDERAILEAIDNSGRGLRVSFHRHIDRYAHTIGLVEDHQVIPLLASEEGSRSEDWPASPPLIDLHVEERPHADRVVLLVGLAGSSHWSLSASANTQRRAVIFDVACRAKHRPPWLGSSYRTMVPPSLSKAGRSAWMEISGLRGELCIEPADSGPEAELITTDARLSICPPPQSAPPPPTTIRWKYLIRYA